MPRIQVPALIAISLLCTVVAGCAEEVVTANEEQRAAIVEPIQGSELQSVTLSDEAAERLGVETAPVQPGPGRSSFVPYAAVLYDADGKAWVYTNPKGHTFVRAPITVDRIDGDVARLTAGPPVGMAVATVAVAELFGSEMGVGDPE